MSDLRGRLRSSSSNNHCRHGLSYTTFDIGGLVVRPLTADADDIEALKVQVDVTIKNVGGSSGSEVAQLYVTYPRSAPSTPLNQLRAFGKAKDLAAGETKTLTLTLDKYAFAYWDEVSHQWKIAPGVYELHIGNSSDNFVAHGSVEIGRGYNWKGL